MRDKLTDWMIGCMKRKVQYQQRQMDTAEVEMLRAKQRMNEAQLNRDAFQATVNAAISQQRAASIQVA